MPSLSMPITWEMRHLSCPFCGAYDVGRLYVASVRVDSCECSSCGSRWDEDTGSGAYRGRADRASVLIQRQGECRLLQLKGAGAEGNSRGEADRRGRP